MRLNFLAQPDFHPLTCALVLQYHISVLDCFHRWPSVLCLAYTTCQSLTARVILHLHTACLHNGHSLSINQLSASVTAAVSFSDSCRQLQSQLFYKPLIMLHMAYSSTLLYAGYFVSSSAQQASSSACCQRQHLTCTAALFIECTGGLNHVDATITKFLCLSMS